MRPFYPVIMIISIFAASYFGVLGMIYLTFSPSEGMHPVPAFSLTAFLCVIAIMASNRTAQAYDL